MSDIVARQAAEILRQDDEIERLRSVIFNLHRHIVDTELQLANLRETINEAANADQHD